ncbi:MAG TPA: ATP-binding protein [Nitrospirota bacterium]|nr:ATP-binding protein [Nitrospirota bacterium]
MSAICTSSECITSGQHKTAENIKERETAVNRLQLSTQQYEQLLQSLPNGLVLVSREGTIIHANARMENLFGWSKSEMIGENVEILVPRRFRAHHRMNVTNFFADPHIRQMGSGLELFGLRKDGTEFPIDISLSFLGTDDDVVAMAVVKDITDYKRVEHRMELNLQVQKAISSVLKISLESGPLKEQINSVLDLILTIPRFAMHTRASIHLLEQKTDMLLLAAMHGFSADEAISCKSISLKRGAPSDEVPACPIIGTGCIDEPYDIQSTAVGSATRYCVPIVFGERPLGLINVTIPDDHERIEEEEEFLSAIANSLAILINRHQTEAEKSRLQEQLAENEKLAALGRITANVSHTIKNPLMVIGGFANRLLDALQTGSKEKKYAGLIYTEAVRLENVLQNVLLFSRRDAGRREECDLSQIIEKALTMYEDICKEKSITINRDYHDTPSIIGNDVQVLQAIENLLSNAVDAMPRGGTLTVITDRENVSDSTYATLKIRDTGHGIQEDNLSKIFEPFFTTKVFLKGTGLGLSIAKKVLDDHGGFIRVVSEVGAGTTFSLYFPIFKR